MMDAFFLKVVRSVALMGLVFIPALAAMTAAGQTNSPMGEPANPSVRLPLEFKHGHFFVEALAQGSNTIRLMLDTGFSISMVDAAFAERLRLKRIGQTRIAGIAGEEEADVFEGARLDFGALHFAPRRVAALHSDTERPFRGMKGVLGADFFRRFVVELDSKAKTIQLQEPQDYRYSGAGEILPLHIRHGAPVVEASINIPGQAPIQGRFEVDTGCDGGLCLGHDFVEANHLLPAAGPVEGGGRIGLGGAAQTKVGTVPQLQLGRIRVENPEANFFLQGSPVDRGHAGHIGMGILRDFRMVFDYSREQLILEP